MRKSVKSSTIMLRALSVCMAWVLCISPVLAERSSAFATGHSRATGSRKPTVKDQVANIPAGSLVNVRLKNRDEARGTLGAVSDQGIVLQVAKKKQIEEKKIAFSEMKSVSVIKPHSAAFRILLPIAIVAGVLLGIALISLTVRPPG